MIVANVWHKLSAETRLRISIVLGLSMSKIYKSALAIAVASAFVLGATAASANATFSDATGQYTVGIGPDGELYDSITGVGLKNPAGSDYISPGTPRDSWGISSQAGSAYADYAYNGTSNILGTTTTLGVNSATTVSTTGIGLTVGQTFTFFSPNIVSVQETVTNNSLISQTISFRRDVDYDVFPTEFNENTVGPFGSDAQVTDSSYYGFESADPSVPFSSSCFTGCNQTGDLGAGIDLNLGTLGVGASETFAYFYGINEPGQFLNGLFAEAQSEGLAYTIGTQSSENGQYPNLGAGSAILGVGLVGTIAHAPVAGVPEPGAWALMLAGFGAIGFAMRNARRNKAAVAAA